MTLPFNPPAAAAPMLELQGASLQMGEVQVLQGVSLRIHAGERVAVVGANGSGKSSLLRLLHGLLRPTHGVRQAAAHARQAMCFQHPHMLRASALANVSLGLWLKGVPWREAGLAAAPALARVGLGAHARRWAHQLSGGQKQRLALARAWALRPDILFLDEPTASLDPHAKREVESLMGQFAADGVTLVFSSHNLGQVKRLASRVLYLEAGRVLADLPVEQFFIGTALRETSIEADMFVRGELG